MKIIDEKDLPIYALKEGEYVIKEG